MDKEITYKEFKRKKRGDFQSVGIFGDNIYAHEMLTGFANTPEYRQITKQEFDTFEEWGKEAVTDVGLHADILNRDILCTGKKGETTIKEALVEVTCPVCKTTFLLENDDIPDEEDLYIYCPNCNKSLEERLIDEIKSELKKANVEVDELLNTLRTFYINPHMHSDMRGYVEIKNDDYILKVKEYGNELPTELAVTDSKEAAYWIMLQLLHQIEAENHKDEHNEKKREKRISKELESYFKKMDPVYDNWFMEKPSIIKFLKNR